MARLLNRYYFSKKNQMLYMGVSQFKSFQKCPASALAEVKGTYQRTPTKSLLVGSYVDAYFEGKLDKFKKQHSQIFKKDGSLKTEYIQAEKIIERIEKDKLFVEFMSGEKQKIMTGYICNVPVKIKIDSYLPNDKIVDLKIMKDFKPIYVEGKGRLSWIETWGYDIQGAVYQEIVYQNTGKKLPFYLAAATKEAETDIDIIQIPQSYLDVALDEFKRYVQEYDAIKKGVLEPARCECCDYCKQTKVLKSPKTLEDYIYAE